MSVILSESLTCPEEINATQITACIAALQSLSKECPLSPEPNLLAVLLGHPFDITADTWFLVCGYPFVLQKRIHSVS